MSNQTRAMEIFNQHLAMASVDGRTFRRTVREQIMAELGSSGSAASTYYNNCKKEHEEKVGEIPGLGRGHVAPGNRKVEPAHSPKPMIDEEVPEELCFTVLEVDNLGEVGRTQSFIFQEDAGECLKSRRVSWPKSTWVLVQGLGPNPGEIYKRINGTELGRYSPPSVPATKQNRTESQESQSL